MDFVTARDLRRLRKKAGLTQEALARQAGCSTNTVSRFEQGRHLSLHPLIEKSILRVLRRRRIS